MIANICWTHAMGALLRLSQCFPKTTCKERLSTILFHNKEIHSLEDLNNSLEVIKEGSERWGADGWLQVGVQTCECSQPAHQLTA